MMNIIKNKKPFQKGDIVKINDIDEAFFMIRYSLSEKAWYGE